MAYLSSVAVAVGVFLPLTSVPAYGGVSYNDIAEVESYLVIAAALSLPALILMGWKRLSVFSAASVWIVLLLPAIKQYAASTGRNGFMDQVLQKVSGPLQDISSDLFINITHCCPVNSVPSYRTWSGIQ